MLKIGHRGACGYEPENTLRSFKKALELNVDMIELDVHLCKSGELVVIHNGKVNHTTDSKGAVENKTLSELKSLDAGKGEKIPTLEEVLDMIDGKIPVNIELKGKNTAQPAAAMIDNYVNEKGWTNDDFLVSSFDHKELKKFHKLNNKIKIGYLIDSLLLHYVRYISQAKKLNSYSINPSLRYVNKKLVSKAHQNGFKVFVYTVNEKEDIEKMRAWGVDGIFSNYPDRI